MCALSTVTENLSTAEALVQCNSAGSIARSCNAWMTCCRRCRGRCVAREIWRFLAMILADHPKWTILDILVFYGSIVIWNSYPPFHPGIGIYHHLWTSLVISDVSGIPHSKKNQMNVGINSTTIHNG